MDNQMVYLTALEDSLKRKGEDIKEILELTKEQERVLNADKLDGGRFEEILNEKDKLLTEISELDKGFESFYSKISAYLEKNKYSLRGRILEIQNLIRLITDMGMEIQVIEKRNNEKFKSLISREKKDIGKSRMSSKTAQSYYQNMPNQHKNWQTYFLDKKQ